ncbi:hypothetical protein NL676_006673 [Syzygium grande]|nr:hypothetical protein NL676_006673 [Syzygium grande]
MAVRDPYYSAVQVQMQMEVETWALFHFIMVDMERWSLVAFTQSSPPPNPPPLAKGQLYGGASRSASRPQPKKSRRHCRAAAAGAASGPPSPSSSSSSSSPPPPSTSKFDLTVSARNPNSKLVHICSPISVSVLSTDGVVDLGDATIPSFVHGKKNTTVLKTSIASNGQQVDSGSASKLKSGLKSKSGLALKIRLDTKVKGGGLKTPRVGIRVTCGGIRATAPAAGKSAATASTGNAKCKVDTRTRIWNWTP